MRIFRSIPSLLRALPRYASFRAGTGKLRTRGTDTPAESSSRHTQAYRS